LTDEQKARYREQLEAILDHVAKLQELDTQDVPPTASVVVGQMPLRVTSRARPSQMPCSKMPQNKLTGNSKIPPVFE